MSEYTLDEIIDALDRNRQRATYGAVAGVVHSTARTLMKGREREQKNSWIVSTSTGIPTGYPPDALHPELKVNQKVLRTKEELSEFLAERMAAV